MFTKSLKQGTALVLLSLTLVLAGCDSSEERAEQHYKAGLELLEAGDVSRAMVEFRNVFKLNNRHREARETYARIQRERGEMKDAYGQYLRLVEQYPDDLEGRRALAEMAIQQGNWDEAERHGRAAVELAPTDDLVIAINAALDYRKAVLVNDTTTAAKAVEISQGVLDRDGDSIIARRVLIDQMRRDSDWAGALAHIDHLLTQNPKNLSLHEYKLQTLVLQQDQAAIGAHLEEMFGLFPENERIRSLLISWYIENGDMAGAEAFLREMARTEDPATSDQAKVSVVQFLMQAKGRQAARDELANLIAAEKNTPLFRSMLASMDFEDGKVAEAIAEMESILKDAPPSDQTRNIKVALAAMLEASGNSVGASARAEEVLAEDPTHVAALRMRATRQILADSPDEAISTLRTALDQDPRDAATLTLMAQAHLRDGSRELAGERLALAVEVSNQRAAESLRYAQFLMEDNRLPSAETVLVEALRKAPNNLNLLMSLGEIYLRQADWPRSRSVVARMEKIGTPDSKVAATRLQVSQLFRERKTDDSIALLEQLAGDDEAHLDAAADIVRAHLQNGDLDRAVNYVDSMLAKNPDSDGLRYLRAGIHAVAGQSGEAESIYRDLIARNPATPAPVQALVMLLGSTGKPAEALEVLETGLEATERDPGLLFLKAGNLEAKGDIPGAIAAYDEIYGRDTTNTIVANNLASLIGTYSDDPAELERAFAVARRLRGSDVPQFQDTYGWIEYRRGNYSEALAHLEPAAKSLADDPMVQVHLGTTYASLERAEEAKATLARALELAGENMTPQLEEARTLLMSLPPGN